MEPQVKQKLNRFFSSYKPFSFKKGELLIRADEIPSGIFYLEEGVVRKYLISSKGEEVVVNLFKKHSFFPMSQAVATIHNNYYYEAMTDLVARKAPMREVLDFVRSNPDVMLDLLRRVYIGVEGIFLHLEHLMSGDAHTKLLTTLIIFAKRFGQPHEKGIYVNLKMAEKDLASYSGIARETVSRQLAKLIKKKLVAYSNHHLIIKDLNALQEELEEVI